MSSLLYDDKTETYLAWAKVNVWPNVYHCAIARIFKLFKGMNMAFTSDETSSVSLQRVFGGPSLSPVVNWYSVSTDWFYRPREFMTSSILSFLRTRFWMYRFMTYPGLVRQENKIQRLLQHFSVLWAELYAERMQIAGLVSSRRSDKDWISSKLKICRETITFPPSYPRRRHLHQQKLGTIFRMPSR